MRRIKPELVSPTKFTIKLRSQLPSGFFNTLEGSKASDRHDDDSKKHPSQTQDTDPERKLGNSETSLSDIKSKMISEFKKVRSVEILPDSFPKVPEKQASLTPLNAGLAPRRGFQLDTKNSMANVKTPGDKSPIKKSEVLNARLILKSIDTKEKLKLKKPPVSAFDLSKKTESILAPSPTSKNSPERNFKTENFSLKSNYYSTFYKKPTLSSQPLGDSSPSKIHIKKDSSIFKKAESSQALKSEPMYTDCFPKKYSEADCRTKDKSREFKISLSRFSSQAKIRETDFGGADSAPEYSSNPLAIGSSSSKKFFLNGSFSKPEQIQQVPGDIFGRGFDRISFSKGLNLASEAKPKERLNSFAPIASQKVWSDKDEFVVEHQRAIKRNMANRRMRILQSSINLLEREQRETENETVSLTSKKLKRKTNI